MDFNIKDQDKEADVVDSSTPDYTTWKTESVIKKSSTLVVSLSGHSASYIISLVTRLKKTIRYVREEKEKRSHFEQRKKLFREMMEHQNVIAALNIAIALLQVSIIHFCTIFS
mgnify:CR=1 FL=1